MMDGFPPLDRRGNPPVVARGEGRQARAGAKWRTGMSCPPVQGFRYSFCSFVKQYDPPALTPVQRLSGLGFPRLRW